VSHVENAGNWENIWPPTEPSDLIGGIERYIRRFCVLPGAAYLPLSVWCAATYLLDRFDCFPYLALLSPAKRCGKSRVLEVLEILCAKPWRGTAPTAAALYRMMENRPTLLLDEVEVLRGKQVSESQQAILAVLNAGHRKGATVPRCDGPKNELKFFPVYGPKAFACIGKLPDTLTDRSIMITMQRRTLDQKIERFLFGRAKADADPTIEALALWAGEHDEDVRTAYESLPDLAWLSDRDADLWMPLFAVCGVAAYKRLRELKTCALILSGAKQADDAEDSAAIRLLVDIRAIWPEGSQHLSTADMLERLRGLEESPWTEYELTARKLSQKLRPFGATPRQVRIGSATAKGYLRGELDTAFGRYLPSKDDPSETYDTTRVNTGEKDDRANETQGRCFGEKE